MRNIDQFCYRISAFAGCKFQVIGSFIPGYGNPGYHVWRSFFECFV